MTSGVPAVGEEVVAGEVDDRVAAVDAPTPSRPATDGSPWTTWTGAHRRVAADLVGLPREDHRLVAPLDQPPDQVPADQARPARDEHAHASIAPSTGSSLDRPPVDSEIIDAADIL